MAPYVPGDLAGEPVLVAIGDISVTQTRVFTPSGSIPVGDARWTCTDMSVTTQEIPVWAIVCAVVFALACLLGLLFLLVKEPRTRGTVQVTVQGTAFAHTTQIPVASPAQIADLGGRVSHARAVSASAQARVAQTDPGPSGDNASTDSWSQPPPSPEPPPGQESPPEPSPGG
jgi:hypothetical protein